jgi:ubiquinone/menaquinone biosynthesis C-methylase UbiE
MKKQIKKLLLKPVPQEFSKNFVVPNPQSQADFEEYLRNHYYKNYAVFDQSHDLKQDLNDQLFSRLERVRKRVVPWLSAVKSLKGANILEIGCGTGSSLVAFCEQGASVTGLDVDPISLEVAAKRLSLFDLNAELVQGNAQEMEALFKGQAFDFIIFSATLEHMTLEERLAALRAAQSIMRQGDFLVVVETPNRLWHYDFHTALMPFYFWLPDELAFEYSKHSKRKNFGDVYHERTDERFKHFQRRGRGVSYHDFEVAFGDLDRMKVISGLEQFLTRPLLRFFTDRLRSRGYFKYKVLIGKVGPSINDGFYEPWLNLIFKKS